MFIWRQRHWPCLGVDSIRTGGSSLRGRLRRTLPLPVSSKSDLLCLSTQGVPRLDSDELSAWSDWDGQRSTPKELLGEAFTAAAAWLCVAACDALAHGAFEAAKVSVVGANQTAVGCRFINVTGESPGQPTPLRSKGTEGTIVGPVVISGG